jgi:hypothetical protein
MSAHTPGPWEIGRIPTRKRRQIAGVCIDISAGENTIARVWATLPAHQRAADDARLIAAAPELLAALKDVFRLIDEGFRPGHHEGW